MPATVRLTTKQWNDILENLDSGTPELDDLAECIEEEDLLGYDDTPVEIEFTTDQFDRLEQQIAIQKRNPLTPREIISST